MVFRFMLREVVSCWVPLLTLMLDLRTSLEYSILLKGLLGLGYIGAIILLSRLYVNENEFIFGD